MPRWGFIQSELDLKLLVLYIMDHAAGPMTFLQLLEVALCDGGVNYFSLIKAVTDMVEAEQLTFDGSHYSITENGHRNSTACESSLPYSVRMHCNENLIRVNDLLRQEAQTKTSIRENEDGTQTVALHLQDIDGSPLFHLEIMIPDKKLSEQTVRVFRRDPAMLYRDISELLVNHCNKQEENK